MENKENMTENNTAATRSHESLFGTLLLVALIIFTVASIVGVGFVAYAKWRVSRQASGQPSITALTAKQQGTTEGTTETQSDLGAEKEDNKTTPDLSQNGAKMVPKETSISILNGGAAKGSAAVAADLLKKEGYTKTIAGNATGDYTGVTIYYASGLEAVAGTIKDILVKKYPNTVIKAALPENKETSVSPITAILGK